MYEDKLTIHVDKYRPDSCEVYCVDRHFGIVKIFREHNRRMESPRDEHCYMCGKPWGDNSEILALAFVKRGDNGNILICQDCANKLVEQGVWEPKKHRPIGSGAEK